MVIPAAIREMARIRPGDELEVGCSDGLIVLRKRRPLTVRQVRSLLTRGRELPPMRPEDETAVAETIESVRRRTER